MFLFSIPKDGKMQLMRQLIIINTLQTIIVQSKPLKYNWNKMLFYWNYLQKNVFVFDSELYNRNELQVKIL